MKNQIRIKNKNKYEIEVNDNGDTISFNLDDPTLPLKFDDTLLKLNEVRQKLKAEELIVKKQKDEQTDGILTKNNRRILELEVKACDEMKKIFDGFLGEGACKKIFGDANYLGMFEELIDQLGPHFTAMKLDAEHYKKAIEEKYKDDEDEEVLS